MHKWSIWEFSGETKETNNEIYHKFKPQEPNTHWTDIFVYPPVMLPRLNAQSVHKEALLYKERLA